MGQNRKNSRRAHVFRFAPESGHCATDAACPFRATSGHRAFDRSAEKLACKLLEGVDGSLRGLADLDEVTVRITHVAAQFVAVIIEGLGEESVRHIRPVWKADIHRQFRFVDQRESPLKTSWTR